MVYSEYLVDDRYINEENIDCFNRRNVIIIKTNSLRIGWIYANKNYIKLIRKSKSPFNVNKIAQIAGNISISDRKHLEVLIYFESLKLNNKSIIIRNLSFTNLIKRLPINTE